MLLRYIVLVEIYKDNLTSQKCCKREMLWTSERLGGQQGSSDLSIRTTGQGRVSLHSKAEAVFDQKYDDVTVKTG